MSRLIDNLIAYRVLSMLVTPFTDTDAFKLGIVDAKGKNLRKSSALRTTEEKDAYDYLTRLVFNMKKILLKLPGGDSKLKNIVAALYLVREYYEHNDKGLLFMEDRYTRVLDKVNGGVSLVEEEIIVQKFLEEEGAAAGVANVTGAGVSTDVPAPLKKDIAKYKNIARRKKPVEVK